MRLQRRDEQGQWVNDPNLRAVNAEDEALCETTTSDPAAPDSPSEQTAAPAAAQNEPEMLDMPDLRGAKVEEEDLDSVTGPPEPGLSNESVFEDSDGSAARVEDALADININDAPLSIGAKVQTPPPITDAPLSLGAKAAAPAMPASAPTDAPQANESDPAYAEPAPPATTPTPVAPTDAPDAPQANESDPAYANGQDAPDEGEQIANEGSAEGIAETDEAESMSVAEPSEAEAAYMEDEGYEEGEDESGEAGGPDDDYEDAEPSELSTEASTYDDTGDEADSYDEAPATTEAEPVSYGQAADGATQEATAPSVAEPLAPVEEIAEAAPSPVSDGSALEIISALPAETKEALRKELEQGHAVSLLAAKYRLPVAAVMQFDEIRAELREGHDPALLGAKYGIAPDEVLAIGGEQGEVARRQGLRQHFDTAKGRLSRAAAAGQRTAVSAAQQGGHHGGIALARGRVVGAQALDAGAKQLTDYQRGVEAGRKAARTPAKPPPPKPAAATAASGSLNKWAAMLRGEKPEPTGGAPVAKPSTAASLGSSVGQLLAQRSKGRSTTSAGAGAKKGRQMPRGGKARPKDDKDKDNQGKPVNLRLVIDQGTGESKPAKAASPKRGTRSTKSRQDLVKNLYKF